MKLHYFLLGALIFLLACAQPDNGSSSTNPTIEQDTADQVSTEILSDTLTETTPDHSNSPKIFPFAHRLEDFEAANIHPYGGGDCWGTLRNYTKGDFVLASDSMSCGEYGFEYKHYLLENDELVLAHFQSTEIYWIEDNSGVKQILKEEIYDFHEDKSKYLVRIDTLDRRDFNLLAALPFVEETPQTQREIIDSLYTQSWERELVNE